MGWIIWMIVQIYIGTIFPTCQSRDVLHAHTRMCSNILQLQLYLLHWNNFTAYVYGFPSWRVFFGSGCLPQEYDEMVLWCKLVEWLWSFIWKCVMAMQWCLHKLSYFNIMENAKIWIRRPFINSACPCQPSCLSELVPFACIWRLSL